MTEPRPGPTPRIRRPDARPNRTHDPVLPDTTSDERDLGWGDTAEDDDERLLREVPPHHGG
jgi:hypothetical protein